jgi:hypothetical protein
MKHVRKGLEMGDSVSYWLPSLMAVLGFASGVWSEWFRDKRAYRREREARNLLRRDQRAEQRNSFQRETLLELQTVLMKLMQSSSDLNNFDILSIRKHGKRHVEPYPEDVDNETQQAFAKSALLSVLVRDEQTRELVQNLKDALTRCTFNASTVEQCKSYISQAGQCFVAVNVRIGSVLRTLDDEEL